MKLLMLDENFSSGQVEDKEKALFYQIHRVIVEQQLFLDPNFSRNQVIKIGLINKNKVAKLVRKYTGTNLNGYINSLRLEYAFRWMKEHPDAPIKAVALSCGYSNVRTFYRQFMNRCGQTPTQCKEKP